MKFMEGRLQFRFLFNSVLVLCSTAAVYAQSAASVPPVATSTAASAPAASSPAPSAPAASAPAARSAPKVTYVNGQLTISARDASLGDILRAVSTKTGAVIEFPSDRAQEHLSANAGPGPVREVLSSLLNGSRFNYVMLASPTNPNILQRMILTSSEEPAAAHAPEQPLQSAAVLPPAASAPPAEEIQKGLTPDAAAESAAIEQMEVPKDLSPEALEAMMKARREARKLQREQSAASGSSQ
jgi:hypothetical protein